LNLRALLCNRQVQFGGRAGLDADGRTRGAIPQVAAVLVDVSFSPSSSGATTSDMPKFSTRSSRSDLVRVVFLRQGGSQRREVGSPRSDSSRQLLNLSRDPSDLRCHRWLNRGLNRRLSTRLCVRFLEGQSCIVCVGSPTGRDHHPEACRSTHHPLISLCGPL